MTTSHFLFKVLKWSFFLFTTASLCIAVVGYYFYNKLQDELPDIEQLKAIEYKVPLNIYSSDEALLAQFGEKKEFLSLLMTFHSN